MMPQVTAFRQATKKPAVQGRAGVGLKAGGNFCLLYQAKVEWLFLLRIWLGCSRQLQGYTTVGVSWPAWFSGF